MYSAFLTHLKYLIFYWHLLQKCLGCCMLPTNCCSERRDLSEVSFLNMFHVRAFLWRTSSSLPCLPRVIGQVHLDLEGFECGLSSIFFLLLTPCSLLNCSTWIASRKYRALVPLSTFFNLKLHSCCSAHSRKGEGQNREINIEFHCCCHFIAILHCLQQ